MNPTLTLRRQVLLAICLFISLTVQAQTKAISFVQRYPVQQKRLAAVLTGQYLFAIHQGQMDADSAVMYACRQYGVSRLMPYNEAYYGIGTSKAAALLDAGNVSQAVLLQSQVKGEALLRLLCELGGYYLSRPYSLKPDMDSALFFIKRAVTEADAAKLCVWQGESRRLMGRYQFALRNLTATIAAFDEAEKILSACNNQYGVALTWQQKGECLPFNSPEKLPLLIKSQQLFHKLGAREKEVELRSDILGVHLRSDFKAAGEDLMLLLKLEEAIGFKHVMHVHDVLAYLHQAKGDFIATSKHVELAAESITLTGDSTILPFVYGRRAVVYENMHKYEEAWQTCRVILNNRHSQPPIFWYKQFLSTVSFLVYIDRIDSALALMNTIEKEYPPATDYNKMYLMMTRANCYRYMGRIKEAVEQFTSFDALASRFPPEHIYMEMPEAYMSFAVFFADIHDYTKARYCLEKAMRMPLAKSNVKGQGQLKLLEFKLDSAAGKYESALQHYMAFKVFDDSLQSMTQRRQIDEMLIKYATEKKEKDIVVLKQQASLHQAQIKQSNLLRNVTLGGILLLLIITGLLYNRYRTRQRTSLQLHTKNRALQQLVEEKEWLVKEIHHRVKNNLQTIVSLLESQSAYLQDDALLALQDSQNRVYAMSLMHQKLYQTEHMVSIGMNRYLPELVAHLKDSFNIGESISFQQDIADVQIDVSQAIPVGLILNEAITNAIKYAFDDSITPQIISIVMHTLPDGKMQLVIRDNGKGLPADFDSNRTNSLGMRLMKGLSEDIHGVLTIQSQDGVGVTVVFPPNPIPNS
ncbi:two-component sensor histidine kinase/tetratricopeptide (TPR) repeat protein [Filimonas zeae]|uniref:histidine kinase n=1 Tax=Filimonas zeae TaxID=1737353 RepID=A0A917MXT6_9BACT|nr:sensor histidine kinase [Filimonas zeae]MDR6341174.1 two-component sensor histidine kinase/tetratricopeptide (TPR) repeat protein [Filimonas zeae]GGH76928.1 hypothetical protein GCM10011379_42510 [Filimonas zeae]